MRWRFLVQPGWLALTVVVFAFATTCFTLLAPWQFHRDNEREAQNAALRASFVAQPKPLAEVLPGSAAAPDKNSEWQQVVLTGRYLPENEVIARLRTVQGEAAFEVLTPFRADSGDIVLIDRGYLRPDEKSRVPSYPAPPTGQVQVTSRARMDEADPKDRDAFADESTQGQLHSYAVNSKIVSKATGLTIRPGYFQLNGEQPGILSPLPLPQLDAGPFFSYALQWIAFGAMAVLGWLYFTVRELKPGGALTGTGAPKEKRKSVAQLLAEDEWGTEDRTTSTSARR